LDHDEYFNLEGAGRGGGRLDEHFGTLASEGYQLIRYVNHELLLPLRPGEPLRFKLNPRLGHARLGSGGWMTLCEQLSMQPSDPRPYFSGYTNGKSAVAVGAGAAAGGVHGWLVSESGRHDAECFLAGPSILHNRFASPEAFSGKYLSIASDAGESHEESLFEPCPAEVRALALLRRLRDEGLDETRIRKRLTELHESLTHFTTAEMEILQEARMILEIPPDFGLTVSAS
jgi:hypothetical protein